MGQKIGYIRVSTVEQNLDRQKTALEKFDIDKLYQDKSSAKNLDRPEFKKMMEFARTGDTIIIHSLDRLARNTRDLLNLIEELEERDIKLVSIKEDIDTKTPVGKLMLTLLGAINQLELDNLKERQAEGIAEAKKRGAYKGRKSKVIDNNFIKLYEKHLNGEIETKVELAKQLGMGRTTLYKLIREYEAKR